jgi:hypothetical protein
MELQTLGLQAGMINSMRLFAQNFPIDLREVTIRIAQTNTTNLSSFEEQNFTTVFDGNLSYPNGGSIDIQFLTPIAWDGNSNLVVEYLLPKNAGVFTAVAADISANIGLTATSQDAYFEPTQAGFATINDAEKVFKDLDSVVSIAFWAKGGESLPSNTSILEGKDANGRRVINIHHPWNNGSIYWDAGNDAGSYDRINKAAKTEEYKDQWNHYTYVKNAKTGSMKIYINGALWHSGSGFTRDMTGISDFRIGKGITNYPYSGKIDDIAIFKTEVSASNIALLMEGLDNSHPDYANLLCAFNFDNYNTSKPSEIIANNNPTITASFSGYFHLDTKEKTDLIRSNGTSSNRPQTLFAITDQKDHLDSILVSKLIPRPRVSIAKFEDPIDVTKNTGYEAGWEAGYTYTFDVSGAKTDSTINNATSNITKSISTYYVKYEVVNNIEIARYITPYGIGLDLGPDGFKWIYDVTDYADLLSGMVTLSAGNQQELIDLRFEFVEGTPNREVKEISYYINRENRNYRSIADNTNFTEKAIAIHPEAETFKLKTRITGHGHNTDEGKDHCCEWADKQHYLKINGSQAFDWSIWQDDKCAENPVIDQGGNWSPPRAGWCPGAPVDDYDFNLTPLISGDSVKIDYDIEPVPTDNLGQGGGNYVVSMHLIQYGDYAFENDAEIVDIIRPNSWEYYRLLNPTCAQPTIQLKNRGKNEMTSAFLQYGVVGGNTISFHWEGNLKPEESTRIDLPFAIWDYQGTKAPHRFFAEVVKVNGKEDEYAGNNRGEVDFNIPKMAPKTFTVLFRNNDIEDATLQITNDQGKVVYEQLNSPGGKLVNESITLDAGCYKLVCETENGFGLNYPLIPEIGAGLLRLSNTGAGFVQVFNTNFGKRIEYYFTVGYSLNVGEATTENTWKLFPNPTQGVFLLDHSLPTSGNVRLTVTDMLGRTVLSSNVEDSELISVDLSDQPAGAYIVKIEDETGTRSIQLRKI